MSIAHHAMYLPILPTSNKTVIVATYIAYERELQNAKLPSFYFVVSTPSISGSIRSESVVITCERQMHEDAEASSAMWHMCE